MINREKGEQAVVLLSGGLDSAVTLAIARHQGLICHAVTFDYGQRHRAELLAAARVARALGAASHRVVKIDLRAVGGSALTDSIEVPKDRSPQRMIRDIPVTYVPARNLTFLSIAAGLAEVIGARVVCIGVNALDYSGYPDCRPEFIRAFEQCLALGTKAGVEGGGGGPGPWRLHTPLIAMSKADIIREGARLHVDLSMTFSCYDPSPEGRACGRCDSCLLRRRGFVEAGIPDPTGYASADR